MFYLLIFVLNLSTLEPVLIKDCIEYRPETEQTLEGHVSEMERSGQYCEQSKGLKSWTCTDQKRFITKLVLLKDLDECKAFPANSASSMKKIFGR